MADTGVTTRKTLTLFTEWLSSPVGTKFSKRIEDMSKEELNEWNALNVFTPQQGGKTARITKTHP